MKGKIMNSKNETTRLTIDIPKNVHKRLKTVSAVSGKSMKQILIDSFNAMNICLESEHIPNKVTEKAIKRSKEKKNLVKAEDMKDLFKKLGI